MAKYGSAAAKIEFDNSSGVLQDMSPYITSTPPSFDREALLAEITAIGDTDAKHAKVGVSRVATITLGGEYDDTATTGPDVIFNAIGDTRTLKVTWGSTKTSEVECIIQNYRRTIVRGSLTTFEVVLQPTGAVTEV